MLQQMRNQKRMLGPYSELTPYIENDLDAMESAILATASMEGKMRNSFLIDRMAVYNKIEGDPNAKKPGLFGGFGGGGGDNGKQQQGGNPFGA